MLRRTAIAVKNLFAVGWTGVDLFFVLSGFIMAAVYWDLQDRADRRAYWAARFARIYPVYLLSLLLRYETDSQDAMGSRLPWAVARVGVAVPVEGRRGESFGGAVSPRSGSQ